MIHIARDLFSNLNNLVLAGQTNGKLEFIGTKEQWDNASAESHMIGISHEQNPKPVTVLPDFEPVKLEKCEFTNTGMIHAENCTCDHDRMELEDNTNLY